MHRGIGRLVTLVILSLLAASTVGAQSAGKPRALVIRAENLMAADARHRAVAARGGDSTALLPGDVVRYSLLFTNVKAGPVRGVVFNDPLPAGLRYDGGTASADLKDVAIDYSIDGGKTYSPQPLVEVEVDGRRVKRPAPSDMYTHIRWTVQGAVLPGAAVRAEFHAHLPEPAGVSNVPRSKEIAPIQPPRT